MDFVFFLISIFLTIRSILHVKKGEYQSVFAICSYDAVTADLVFELRFHIGHHVLGRIQVPLGLTLAFIIEINFIIWKPYSMRLFDIIMRHVNGTDDYYSALGYFISFKTWEALLLKGNFIFITA